MLRFKSCWRHFLYCVSCCVSCLFRESCAHWGSAPLEWCKFEATNCASVYSSFTHLTCKFKMSMHVIQMHSVTFNTMCQAFNAESSAIACKRQKGTNNAMLW